MGSIWVREFIGGLDTRRLDETASGGVLVKANNGHITRGGEFEQRAAFVPTYSLPAGTVGMYRTKAGLVVFGSATAPTLPTGVSYQRLQHSTPGLTLTSILSAALYAGKIYAIGEFSDGSVLHFYDGTQVTDWYDGRARCAVTVTACPSGSLTALTVNGVSVISGAVTGPTTPEGMASAIATAITSYSSAPEYTAVANGNVVNIVASTSGTGPNGFAVALTVSGGLVLDTYLTALSGGGTFGGTVATGSFQITAGAGGDTISPAVNGVALCGAVAWAGSATATATAVAAAINAATTIPDYTATSNAGTVTVATATHTAAVNGLPITLTIVGSMSVLTGGAQATASFVLASATLGSSTLLVRAAGIDLVSAPVAMTGSLAASAAAIVSAINSYTSSPDYTASLSSVTVGATTTHTITITSVSQTSSVNGGALTFVTTGTVSVTGATTLSGGVTPYTTMVAMSGGSVDDAFTPGNFVSTIGTKLYSVAGPILHFSGVAAPTQWTTDAVGAGFIDMSSQTSEMEALVAVARYQGYAAVFAERVVDIRFVDPDPTLNRQIQVLENTGTASPRSITQFGDTDLFYLAESGLRSLRARDASNAASTTDIGVPVDDIVVAKLQSLTEDERAQVIGLIEPVSGRFWLIMKDQIFVFSFFTGAKVSAWSTYDTTYISGSSTVPFNVTEAIAHNRRVYLRSGDTIFCYGGNGTSEVHDATVAELWLPYMDAGSPSQGKMFQAIDAALRGLWVVSGAMDPNDPTAEDTIATLDETTYSVAGSVPFQHHSTHMSLRFRSRDVGPHKLASCIIHYDSDDNAD